MVYSLAFYVSLIVGSISFMISVIVKTTAASIGIMMSTLIAGSFLSYFLSDWKLTRYMYMVHLRLTDYMSGHFQPIEGMSMAFSVTVLGGMCRLRFDHKFFLFYPSGYSCVETHRKTRDTTLVKDDCAK